jgi:hypothetical protein
MMASSSIRMGFEQDDLQTVGVTDPATAPRLNSLLLDTVMGRAGNFEPSTATGAGNTHEPFPKSRVSFWLEHMMMGMMP